MLCVIMYLQGHTEPQSGRPRFTVTLKIALFSLRGRKRYFLLFLYAKITKIKVTNKKILSHVTMRESSNLAKVGRPRAPAACPYKYIINDLQSILYHEKPYFTRFLECLHLIRTSGAGVAAGVIRMRYILTAFFF